MFFSCIYMQANNSKQHVNLRQYINDFKKVFTSGIHRSHFQPLLLLHWAGGVIESVLIFLLLLVFFIMIAIMIIAEEKSIDSKGPLC